MPSGVYFRPNAKPKCPKCNGEGVFYTQVIKKYENDTRDLGYWEPCKCKKNLTAKTKGI
jgi:hypothetical protein